MFVTLTCTRFERSLSPVLDVLHEWLDSWSGIGVIERGMARQGYDLQLTRYANEGWRATFFLTGREHSMTQATGSAWEPTPWQAVQGAAWEALRKPEHAAEPRSGATRAPSSFETVVVWATDSRSATSRQTPLRLPYTASAEDNSTPW